MTNNKTKNNPPNEDIDLDTFQKMIAECAYHRAEKRGFSPCFEIEDWLEAEQEISKQYGIGLQLE